MVRVSTPSFASLNPQAWSKHVWMDLHIEACSFASALEHCLKPRFAKGALCAQLPR
jgi:hypothetical protein